MLDLKGIELSAEEGELLSHPQVSGLILFARNYEEPEQLDALMEAVRSLRPRQRHGLPPLLVGVDHEGGRVQRFHSGFTPLPPVGLLGELYDEVPAQGLDAADQIGWLMAAELLSFGIDLSFAPVLDLGLGVSQVVGDRAFHHDPEVVAALAGAYIDGMNRAGMAATGKHFPGHGSVVEDSHVAAPTDPRDWSDIESQDLIPFRRLGQDRLAAVMPAHVRYPQVDDQPAGFSSRWIREILRGELHFDGVVFSDDLSMAAAGAVGDQRERARRALIAGCDMLLLCNDRSGAISVVEALEQDPADGYDATASHARVARLHAKQRLEREALKNDPDWRRAVVVAEALAGR